MKSNNIKMVCCQEKNTESFFFLGKGIPNPEKQEKCLFIPLAVGKLRDRFAPAIDKK